MNEINLDKICAEYGMDLVRITKEIYKKATEILSLTNTYGEFLQSNYQNIDDKINDFLSHKLINPLANLKKSINKLAEDKKKAEEFERLRQKPPTFAPDTFETEITKALGILIEDGPFAYLIWLKSQDKEPHQAMLIQTARLLAQVKMIEIDKTKDVKEELENKFLNEIGSDLNKLILTKTLFEKMLIYARYKTKAMQYERG